MKKEITMTIHEFMEIERGNLNIENIQQNTLSKINIALLLALVSLMHLFLPTGALAADTSYVQAVNSGAEILYVTSAVILELAYDVITSTAAIL